MFNRTRRPKPVSQLFWLNADLLMFAAAIAAALIGAGYLAVP